MTLHQLRIFLAVAEFKSFTQAGLQLKMSQPDVSLHVRNLENEIGLRLFERAGKRVYLTQAGEVLREKATLLFSQLRDTEQALAEVKGLLRGSLLIGASTTVGLYILSSPVAEFRKRYPGIDVQLKLANTGPVERMTLAMEVDVGFTLGNPIPEVGFEKFMEDEIVLILPPDHRLCKKNNIRARDLNKETFVIREPGSMTRRVFDELFSRSESRPPIFMELDSIQSIKWAVAEGYGISLVPRHAAFSRSKSPRVCVRRLKDFDFPCPVNVIWNSKRKLSPAAEAFLDLARRHAASLGKARSRQA
jgi:DNA-binding transcriptional LysR family regulator